MVVGGSRLAVAGPPAEIQRDDPWAIFEGRAGGELCILDTETGEVLSHADLDASPVWDGMAAAGDVLYVSTTTGRLICFGEPAQRKPFSAKIPAEKPTRLQTRATAVPSPEACATSTRTAQE